jgi:hypothetical protein
VDTKDNISYDDQGEKYDLAGIEIPCPECGLQTPGAHYRGCTLMAAALKKASEIVRREAEARYVDVAERSKDEGAPAKANRHYYMIMFTRPDPENNQYGKTFHIMLTKAPSWFDARDKAEEELKKWAPQGWQMDPNGGVAYLDCEKIDAGEVVGLTTI